MWVTTVITALEFARVGALNLQALMQAMREGRAAVHHADGTPATPESLELAVAHLEQHAAASGDDTVARIAELARSQQP